MPGCNVNTHHSIIRGFAIITPYKRKQEPEQKQYIISLENQVKEHEKTYNYEKCRSTY